MQPSHASFEASLTSNFISSLYISGEVVCVRVFICLRQSLTLEPWLGWDTDLLASMSLVLRLKVLYNHARCVLVFQGQGLHSS